MALPVILQAEVSECGLACLAMVLAGHGDRRGLEALRRLAPGSVRGVSLDALVDLAARVGLSARPLRLELDDLRVLRAPAVLHWDMQHYVVLARADRRGLIIHDPARGRRRVGWQEASRRFSGIALELWPGEGFEPRAAAPTIDWRRLLGPMPGLWSGIGRIGVLALVLEGLVLVGPLFMQSVIDDVLVARDHSLLHLLGIGFLALLAFQSVTMAIRGWSVTTLAQVLGFSWQGRLFRHLLSLPIDFFTRRSLGEVLSRFESLQTIQRTVSSSMLEAVMDGLMAVLTFALMLMFSPLLACLSLLGLSLSMALQMAAIGPMQARNERVIGASARQQSQSIESIRGIQCLRLAAAEQRRFVQWQDLAADSLNERLALDRLSLGLRSLCQWLVGAERIAVVWLAALMVLEQRFTVGVLIAYLAYRDLFAGRAGMLLDRLLELRLLRLHAQRLNDIVESEPEPAAIDPGWSQLERITLHDIGFRYGECEPWILRGLSIDFARGETVAIVGASGCGKTTLLRLLLGLLDPQAGELLVNGRPLRPAERVALRRLCGVVMQDDQLFAGTIGDNIAGFAACADPAAVQQAATLAAIHADIAAMPMGYRTAVGDMGSSLSGGQKQRILLARALYRQPQLLLLDEATSHLDVASERLVNAAIRQLSCTTLVIAHRPETIAMADRVLVLEHGRIVREYRPSLAAGGTPAPARADADSTPSHDCRNPSDERRPAEHPDPHRVR